MSASHNRPEHELQSRLARAREKEDSRRAGFLLAGVVECLANPRQNAGSAGAVTVFDGRNCYSIRAGIDRVGTPREKVWVRLYDAWGENPLGHAGNCFTLSDFKVAPAIRAKYIQDREGAGGPG